MNKPPQPKSKWTELESKEASRLKTQRAQWRSKHPAPELVEFSIQCVHLRKSLKLTQQDFAALLNVTKQTVSRWERKSGHLPSPTVAATFYELKDRTKNEHPKSL